MTDLLVLDSNIVQSEDLGGSNPLCSTIQSCRSTLVSGFEEIDAISVAWRD